MRATISAVLLVGAIAGWLGLVCPAAASHGGPELAEILGWDPGEQKVFCRISYLDETERAPGLFYADLKSPGSPAWRQIAWSRDVDEDSTYLAKVRSLERRLRPLRPIVATTIPEFQTILGIDTLRDEYSGSTVRYRVLASDRSVGSYLLVTTLVDPHVSIIRQYEIPGRPERIGIVAFRGVPFETMYETQVPFLIRGGISGAWRGDTVRVVRFLREYESER